MRFALIFAALLLGPGCSHAPPHWTELSSRHFLLRTDLPPRTARTALQQFETTYTALQTLAFANDPPRERIDFILFRHEADFRQLAPKGATGYFMPHQLDEPDPLPTIAMFGDYGEAMQRRFTHELTHRFMDHQLSGAPAWLEEGLAEYYSTMKVDSDGVVLGLLSNENLFRLELVTGMALSDDYVDPRVAINDVPTVKELLAADHEDFHRLAHEIPYYFASWTLVHMMLHGPHDYRGRFSRYINALTAGVESHLAWQHEFAGVDEDLLDRQFRNYMVKLYLSQKSLHARLPRAEPVDSERPLGDDEVHLLLARIRPWDCRENIMAAGHELALARELAGNRAPAELHYWNALYAERWRRFPEAERELDRALTIDPKSERYWLALAELIARPDRQDPLEVARLDEAVAHLKPLAATGEALDFVAHYYADKGDAERGLPFAQRAAALLPDCRSCAETLSALRGLVQPSAAEARDVYTRPSIQ